MVRPLEFFGEKACTRLEHRRCVVANVRTVLIYLNGAKLLRQTMRNTLSKTGRSCFKGHRLSSRIEIERMNVLLKRQDILALQFRTQTRNTMPESFCQMIMTQRLDRCNATWQPVIQWTEDCQGSDRNTSTIPPTSTRIAQATTATAAGIMTVSVL